MQKIHAFLSLLLAVALMDPAYAGPFAPAAGQPGSTAIPFDHPGILGWATQVQALTRGPTDISDPLSDLASHGVEADTLGAADAMADSLPVLSLGDGGHVTLTFEKPLANGMGPDFAVFENGFADIFLELAFVEVSSNGTDFFRFPSISLTQSSTQIGSFGAVDPTNIHNLAGKYRRGFGTPFDLADLPANPGLSVGFITHVRIVDVVGSIQPEYRTVDSFGNPVNDPWPTNFETGGFDLDAVAVLNFAVPEPGSLALLTMSAIFFTVRRRK